MTPGELAEAAKAMRPGALQVWLESRDPRLIAAAKVELEVRDREMASRRTLLGVPLPKRFGA